LSQYDFEADITTQLTLSSNNSLRSTAHTTIDREAGQWRKPKQDAKPTKAANILDSCHENNSKDYDKTVLDHSADGDWSQNQYQGFAMKEKEDETRKLSKAISYQLEQWILETSNSHITFAERLERSKWKYGDAGTEECSNVEESCGSWGRKSYDWILFDE
jgi:hypothetical protein